MRDKQVKIELLNQWKLEAESRNNFLPYWVGQNGNINVCTSRQNLILFIMSMSMSSCGVRKEHNQREKDIKVQLRDIKGHQTDTLHYITKYYIALH